jgi:Rrf2 family protein
LGAVLFAIPSGFGTVGTVKLSVKSDYAARAVLGLARQYPSGEARRAEDLADEFDVPANYLVQILIELKSRRIVRSVRGKEGGYLLARPPSEITLGDVLRCVHGQVFDTPALSDANCPPELRQAWQQVQQALNDTADAINFQQLADAGVDKETYYI